MKRFFVSVKTENWLEIQSRQFSSTAVASISLMFVVQVKSQSTIRTPPPPPLILE